MKKICSFFGHKEIEINENLKIKLKEYIENLIQNEHFDMFYFGGFSNFDDLCWQIVTELKEKHNHIKRIYCLTDQRHLRPSKRPKWLKNEDYEDFIYLPLTYEYWVKRIYYRNCEMINSSNLVIFYITNTENSGAFKAMQYAQKKKIKFINFADIISNYN